MSTKFPGGFITKNYVAPTPAAAPGIWTLDQQLQAQKTGTWPFGGPFTYVEDVFSTYLFTGNGTTQTVTNGINLTGKGGMVWRKQRDAAADHFIADTVRGTYSTLSSNTTAAASGSSYIDFLSDGFQAVNSGSSNPSGALQASWTFRKQPKFFDVVTYTGNGVAGRTVAHALGSVPGCMMVKATSTTSNWATYHASLGATQALFLNTTNAFLTSALYWNNTAPTSAVFTLGDGSAGNLCNTAGVTYVAYLFAHNAGGFGSSATDNVISCGSYAPDGSGNVAVTLGYEPQWILFKTSTGTDNWKIQDTMRGASQTTYATLFPNLSDAEDAGSSTSYHMIPNATGFTMSGQAAGTYIYIAIRRGPMKVPTDGTKVFSPVTRTGTGATATGTAGFAPDLVIPVNRPHDYSGATPWFDKLRGVNQALYSNTSGAEENRADTFVFSNTGVIFGTNAIANSSSASYINWYFRRAPGFFDEVCYTGTNAPMTIGHNLTVVPELIINKSRTITGSWFVYAPSASATFGFLNTTDAFSSLGSQVATATTYDPVSYSSTSTYVSYLFATCPGVSKVGSYTGTGASQIINCGFTAGARFVLIKRTDSTGGWYTYDTARGMVTGTDPYLFLNSTAAEVNADYVFTSSTGFTIQAAAPAEINASGGSYIFLAIA